MPIVNRPFNQLSDLVLHEKDPAVGYARESVFVDVAADTPVTMGTVAFRAKGVTNAAYTLLTAPGQLLTTNEYIVLFGDRYSAKDSGWTLLAADTTINAVGFVRDNVILKDYLLRLKYVTGAVLSSTEFDSLVHLLKEQGVIVERTI